MDTLGLFLGIPVAYAANVFYVLLVRFGVFRFRGLWPWLLVASYFILACAVFDLAFNSALGAIETRTIIGRAYWGIHLLVFAFGGPALANVLVLTDKKAWSRRWPIAMVVCGLFGVFLVFFQYGVVDALFGPDGVGGPFSP